MGMYTEVVVKFNFYKGNLSDEELNALDWMFNSNTAQTDEPTALPKHDFFSTPRWSSIGKSSSFYHHPAPLSSWLEFEYSPCHVYVFSRSDLENYDNKINLFFDWLNTLNCMDDGEYLGYSLYEEYNSPTIYNKKNSEHYEDLLP